MEIMVDECNTYDEILNKATQCLGITAKGCHLVRMSGCIILNQPITEEGLDHPWTFGRYVRTSLARNTNVKLGFFCDEVRFHAHMTASQLCP